VVGRVVETIEEYSDKESMASSVSEST